MDFSGNNTVQRALPQFSELTSRSNTVSTAKFTSCDTQTEQSPVYTTATASDQTKQNLSVRRLKCVYCYSLRLILILFSLLFHFFQMNSTNKYSAPILVWPDPNTFMQLCEKQGIQTINIPNYNQNNTILSVQPNSSPVRIMPNVYLPSTSQLETAKQDMEMRTENEKQTSPMVEIVFMIVYKYTIISIKKTK